MFLRRKAKCFWEELWGFPPSPFLDGTRLPLLWIIKIYVMIRNKRINWWYRIKFMRHNKYSDDIERKMLRWHAKKKEKMAAVAFHRKQEFIGSSFSWIQGPLCTASRFFSFFLYFEGFYNWTRTHYIQFEMILNSFLRSSMTTKT